MDERAQVANGLRNTLPSSRNPAANQQALGVQNWGIRSPANRDARERGSGRGRGPSTRGHGAPMRGRGGQAVGDAAMHAHQSQYFFGQRRRLEGRRGALDDNGQQDPD